MPPRAQLTMRTPFFILANAAASIRPRGLGRERHVHGDEVGAREEVVERDELDAELAPPLSAVTKGS